MREVVDIALEMQLIADRLRAIEDLMQEMERCLLELQTTYGTLTDDSQLVIRQAQQHKHAADLLGVTIPQDALDQIEMYEARLSSAKQHLFIIFEEPQTPQRSDALEEIVKTIPLLPGMIKRTVNAAKNRIFKTILTRREELFRLILITFHVITRDGKRVGRNRKRVGDHPGFGKSTVLKKLMVYADFCGEEEYVILDEIWKDKDSGRKEAIEHNKIKWTHFFRPSPDGKILAEEFLQDCIDQDSIVKRIDDARKRSNSERYTKRAEHAKAKKSDTTS